MDKVKKSEVTDSEIVRIMTEDELQRFYKWISGQTCPLLPSGELGYYSWDVERFLSLVRRGKPTYFD